MYEKILKYFVLEIISIYVLESALMCELSMISLCEYISLEYSIFIHTNATTYIKLILSLWFFLKLAIDYEIVLGEIIVTNVLRSLVAFAKT